MKKLLITLIVSVLLLSSCQSQVTNKSESNVSTTEKAEIKVAEAVSSPQATESSDVQQAKSDAPSLLRPNTQGINNFVSLHADLQIAADKAEELWKASDIVLLARADTKVRTYFPYPNSIPATEIAISAIKQFKGDTTPDLISIYGGQVTLKEYLDNNPQLGKKAGENFSPEKAEATIIDVFYDTVSDIQQGENYIFFLMYNPDIDSYVNTAIGYSIFPYNEAKATSFNELSSLEITLEDLDDLNHLDGLAASN